MDDLRFQLEIDGEHKQCKIVFSYYNENNDNYYIIFEIEQQENLEAAILVSKSDQEVILQDIEADEEFNTLMNEYDKYLDHLEKLENENK